jgi:putative sigma-54 modulation protein
MKLTVTGRHLAVTETTRTDLTKRLGRLERVLSNGVVSAQCVIGKERQAFVCDLTVHARADHMLHSVGRANRLDKAVQQAVERVAQQAQRLADRWKTRKRMNGRVASPAVPDSAPSKPPRIVRSRDYAVKPMNLEDAVLELSTGPRAFLVFRHASSERIAVLFRRPDGHFGLIDPEA